MTDLDHLSMSIIVKAVDFLFDQAAKILQESKHKRDKSSVEIVSSNDGSNFDKSDIVKSVSNRLSIKEVQHCLNQIELYMNNVHRIETQIAIKGGDKMAPPELIYNLEANQNDLRKWIQKLKRVVESAAKKRIHITGLE